MPARTSSARDSKVLQGGNGQKGSVGAAAHFPEAVTRHSRSSVVHTTETQETRHSPFTFNLQSVPVLRFRPVTQASARHPASESLRGAYCLSLSFLAPPCPDPPGLRRELRKCPEGVASRHSTFGSMPQILAESFCITEEMGTPSPSPQSLTNAVSRDVGDRSMGSPLPVRVTGTFAKSKLLLRAWVRKIRGSPVSRMVGLYLEDCQPPCEGYLHNCDHGSQLTVN